MKLVAYYWAPTPINNGASRLVTEVLEFKAKEDQCNLKMRRTIDIGGFWAEDSKNQRIFVPASAVIRYTFIED